MQRIFRVPPALPAAAMKTYSITAPHSTHFRPATCTEVNCPQQLLGWETVIDEATDLGAAQAGYIRRECAADGAAPAAVGVRRYTETRSPEGLTVFTFPAGQRCFAQHQTRLDKPEIYTVRGGDWRQYMGDLHRYQRADQWVDDFACHQQTLADRLARG